ncbi:hypothetical protein [Tropicimonas aquimaris]|uniref:Uncharacterized protein n=1 Tax=Tropicimonas aquimaris TaxID=914152 RepID=A0ABW3ISW3_9RHOB
MAERLRKKGKRGEAKRNGMNRQAVEEALKLPSDTPARIDRIHRRLERKLKAYPRHRPRLRPKVLLEIMESQELSPGLRDVLDRFLVSLVFRNAPEIFDEPELNALRLRALAADGDDARSQDPVGAYLNSRPEEIRTLYLGSLHYAMRNVREAYDAFDRSRRAQLAIGRFPHMHTGLAMARTLDELVRLGTATDAPVRAPVTFDSDRSFAEDKPLFLVGVDQKYFDLFSEGLIASADGRVNLHFHIANPTDGPRPTAGNIRYSFETAPHDTAYYASMRFLRMPEILRHHGAPRITAIDADKVFTTDPAEYNAYFEGKDMGLTVFYEYPSQLFWNHCNAQVVTMCDTPAAEGFMAVFSRLFDELFVPQGQNWWIDQALLAHAIHVTKATGHGAHIVNNRSASDVGAIAGLEQVKGVAEHKAKGQDAKVALDEAG